MDTKINYKGRTTTISDRLYEPSKNEINNPKISNRFGEKSLYYDGVYYFFSSVKNSTEKDGKPFQMECCYYHGKWYQDIFYLTKELKEFLEQFWKPSN